MGWFDDDYDDIPPKHRECKCGCGELADECGKGGIDWMIRE